MEKSKKQSSPIELIIDLIKEGYYPELLEVYEKINSNWTLSYNKKASTLYLRKGNTATPIPKGYEWFALSYYNLKKVSEGTGVKVFISYSHKDFELAYQIWKILNEVNISCYLSELYPEPGVSLWKKIQKMIENADVVIVLYTKNANYSPFVNQELGAAVSKGKPIIPIVEEGVEIKGALSGLEYIKLDNQNPTNTLTQVIEALKNFIQKKQSLEGVAAVLLLVLALAWLSETKK
ncbi:MAG: toll/interleukin-1 receptor domain-containing protein [Thermoproteota archaeon]